MESRTKTKARFFHSSAAADPLQMTMLMGLSLTNYFDENALRA
jgi:hypothetical protein